MVEGVSSRCSPRQPLAGHFTVNWFGPGQNLATAAILTLGGDRQLTLQGGNAATPVVIDVTAYVG